MSSLIKKLEDLEKRFDESVENVRDLQGLQDLRNAYLSRKRGHITLLMEELRTLPPEEKPQAGKKLNVLKKRVQNRLDALNEGLEASEAADKIIDPSLPGRTTPWGSPHPLRLFLKDMEDIFLHMGFSIESGPEIETDFYNFEALNFPPHHPARDSWDTLYISDDILLRTHTSPVQIRVMEKRKPPIRIITPGKVYRKESPDPTHLPMFFQVEGLVVDHGITFAHLKGTLEYFLKALFSEKINIRFRPSFFPFTEPSAEVDISCTICNGKDESCRVCGGGGWIEILGAGMVDPQVFKNVNIDPEKYSGFAFGLGVDRTAMFAYQIPDMRYFYENDLRFLRQFMER